MKRNNASRLSPASSSLSTVTIYLLRLRRRQGPLHRLRAKNGSDEKTRNGGCSTNRGHRDGPRVACCFGRASARASSQLIFIPSLRKLATLIARLQSLSKLTSAVSQSQHGASPKTPRPRTRGWATRRGTLFKRRRLIRRPA